MQVDIPDSLKQNSSIPDIKMNYTPLTLSYGNNPNNKKMYLKMIILVLVVGVFSSGFFFIYKNSSAHTLTSDKQFINDIVEASRNKKVIEQKDQTIIIEKKNLFVIMVEKLQSVFTGDKPSVAPTMEESTTVDTVNP